MSQYIRGGVPREINLGEDYDPAEGETISYMISGRGGPVHIAGNGVAYQESNPFIGGFDQTISVDDDQFQTLVEKQSTGEKIVGYVTMANGVTFNFEGGIANDGVLVNDNGTVALECRGKFEKQ